MKSVILSLFCSLFVLGQGVAMAAYSNGSITFYNASPYPVSAQINPYGSITLGSKQGRAIPYTALQQICSANLTSCRANFYVNNRNAGSATINTLTGRLVNIHTSMKVVTSKNSQNQLRSVIIK
jgi:hypothetical protein